LTIPPDGGGEAEILALVARLPFRAARPFTRYGKPQIPHEYTVRR
jgi:hypothetical protein